MFQSRPSSPPEGVRHASVPSRLGRGLVFPLVLMTGLWLGKHGSGLLVFLPPCLIHEWTGLHCPGCGGTRAFRSLAHGDVAGAFALNGFGVILMVFVALWILRVSWEAWFPTKRWPRYELSRRGGWALFWGIIAFSVLRNLPWFPFTLLAPQ